MSSFISWVPVYITISFAIQVAHLSTPPTKDELLSVENSLVSELLFGLTDFTGHGDFTAFAAGLLHVLPSGQTLTQVLAQPSMYTFTSLIIVFTSDV